MVSEDAGRVAATYAEFGRTWAAGTSQLYADWSLGIAGDPELLARIAGLPRRLRQPNLLYAAARWQGAPLEPFASMRPWLLEHWDDVVATASVRSTQTNEPARCATLLPVLSAIEGPVALLETGTAAGLCLLPDRYSYTYDAPSGEHRLGDSPAHLRSRLDDDSSLPRRLPEVVWRRGIDLAPLDAGDPDTIAWLANLVWPGRDHDARVAGLRAAAAIAAADPPEIVEGDILETVADAAADAPHDATLVVFHSAVLMYLSPADRLRFAGVMHGLSAALGRRVVWISNETVGVLEGVDALLPAGLDAGGRFVQSVDGVPVALAGQHGAVYEVRALRPS
ncbi:DUF2332 family protein [Microbacterium sp. NPDC091313]